MAKVFTVTMKYRTVAGKHVKFVGEVTSEPGVDLFQTARKVAVQRQRKGQIARVVRAFAVAA